MLSLKPLFLQSKSLILQRLIQFPMRFLLFCFLLLVIHGANLIESIAREKEKAPAALVEGEQGVVVGTTGPIAVQAGLGRLKKGGSAADAAVATALAQVVECGGCYVSHAGIFTMIYFEAGTGKIHYLNACYNTPREEKDPLSIPMGDKPSGRTVLVPGFMAGVQAAHDRFGKLTRKEVFAPAIEMAEAGFQVTPMLGGFLARRKEVLSRLPKTKKIFTKDSGDFYVAGDLFKQPELARCLRQVSDQGAAHIYTGDWARKFVSAVQNLGGKITLDDMKAYRATWEEPLQTTYRGHQIVVPGFSSTGGVTMIEALHLLEQADLAKRGHYTKSADSLYWLMQFCACQLLQYLPDETLKNYAGLDLTLRNRIKKESAAGIWERMNTGRWPMTPKPSKSSPGHSDGIAVVDRWGNIAVVTHSINTSLWGGTGLFVEGISIPDSGFFQQAEIKRVGPGNRLPDPMCPLLVLKNGKPIFGSSAIGGGLHPRTLLVLSNFLDFGMDPQVAVEQPLLLFPDFTEAQPPGQVIQGQYNAKILEGVRARGQKIKELSNQESGAHIGYLVGVQIVPDSNLRRGIGTRKPPLPATAAGY